MAVSAPLVSPRGRAAPSCFGAPSGCSGVLSLAVGDIPCLSARGSGFLAGARSAVQCPPPSNRLSLDQLVNDKAALSSKCEDLAAEFELVQRKFQEQIKAIEDRQVKELKKQVSVKSVVCAWLSLEVWPCLP